MLGEHTAEVLRELLGMSPEAVAALRAQGVIGGPATA
jgi:crotonobetainyl-CoA:carnitine CoA-transferase CaiB-like acyl-CoA transferase